METTDREALARFARERHVHYDIAPEEVSSGEERAVTAFELRLFAAPGEGKLAPPGSSRHLELLGDLRSFAERLVGTGDAASRTEIVPTAAPPLYTSNDAPGGEEAALTVRVRCEQPEHRAGGREDRCLGELRRRLDEVGVPRR